MGQNKLVYNLAIDILEKYLKNDEGNNLSDVDCDNQENFYVW